MPAISILTETDLRRLVPLDMAAIDCVAAAFSALAEGDVVMPPILRLDIADHNGEVDVKTAYVPGLDSFAIKISPGFFDNPKLGLPSVNGLMVVFSARTGMVETLLLDNGYLTDVRTAAAGAVAARALARPDAASAAILGAGMQARLQLKALTLVRPIERAVIWARDPQKAATAARELAAELGIAVTGESDARTAVAQADVVITTTPATSPVLFAGWLKPGQHVTAMGSDAEHKNELEPSIVALAAPYAADSADQVRRLGELHHAIAAGAVAGDAPVVTLGEIIRGTVAGRTSPDAISVCDLTGTGVQDTAIATLAWQRARTHGAGTRFETT